MEVAGAWVEALVILDGTAEVVEEVEEEVADEAEEDGIDEAEEEVGERFHVMGFEVVSTASTSNSALVKFTQFPLWSLSYTIYLPRYGPPSPRSSSRVMEPLGINDWEYAATAQTRQL